MTGFEIKNRISNICALVAIPGSLANALILFAIFSQFSNNAGVKAFGAVLQTNGYIAWPMFFASAVSILALLVSQFTCGTIWRVFKTALKSAWAVIKFPRVIFLTIAFFVIWFGAAWLVFCAVLLAGILLPAASIALSASSKRYKSLCSTAA